VQNHGSTPTPGNRTRRSKSTGKSPVVQPVPQLAPGERIAVPIAHTFHAAGFHVSRRPARTDHYRSTIGARWCCRCRRVQVLLVDGDPGESADAGETRFLQVALDQGGDVVTGIEPQVVTDAALAEIDLSPFEAVYLCNVSAPTPAVVEKLEKFVAGGGGLFALRRPQVDPARYNEVFWRQGQGLLPLAFGEIAGDPTSRTICSSRARITAVRQVAEGLSCSSALRTDEALVTMIDDPKSERPVIARVRDAEGPARRSFSQDVRQRRRRGGAFAFTADEYCPIGRRRRPTWLSPRSPALRREAQTSPAST